MINVTLDRFHSDTGVTLGILNIEGISHYPIFTLENPWLGNEREISCIPEGEYQCNPFDGKRYRKVWEVTNVPNRSYILFHQGNYEINTRGCILVGFSVVKTTRNNEEYMVQRSNDALNYMRNFLANKEFTLTIS